jgi:pimeloyl-ACP methyl ester carboxylesterase
LATAFRRGSVFHKYLTGQNVGERMGDRIFRNPEAQNRLDEWYRRFLGRVKAPTEHREVLTSHGPSHVLVAGHADRPPLVLLHGSLASSAHAAVEAGPLLERFRVYLPDLPGQSVRGPQVRLSLKDESLARWLLEVLDGLGLETFDIYGVSWGGFVALKTAATAPDRVQRLVLLVPAGIVTGSMWKGFTRIMLPMTLYRWFPSERRLRRFVEGLFTTWDDDWGHYMGDAVRGFVLDLRIPPLAHPESLRAFKGPALVVGADEDISFPGDRLITRAKELIPHVETELIPRCKHAPPVTDEFRVWMADRVTTFLEAPHPA